MPKILISDSLNSIARDTFKRNNIEVDTIIDLSNKRWPKSCVNPNVKSRWGINYI